MTKKEADFIGSMNMCDEINNEAYKKIMCNCEIEESQPCEDCISREAVEKITWEEPSYDDALNVLTEVRDKVRALPSVTPSIPDVENDFNLGYNCGYADAMSDIAESEDKE